MIVGNSYSYRNVRYYEEDDVTYATAEVVNKPSIMVVPFDLFSVSEIDHPTSSDVPSSYIQDREQLK